MNGADHDLPLAAIEARIPDPLPGGHRFVIAIAGPPAAGKSTLAGALRQHLHPRAALLGMDAFHFDNAVLIERGHRERKGAPHTFDVAAYRHTLRALRDEPTLEMSIPVFDRSMELARNCAEIVSPNQQIVITEGNYLLVRDEPWDDLAELFDLTVFVDAPIELIERRVLNRWTEHGLPDDEGRARWERNDRPNSRYVLDTSRAGRRGDQLNRHHVGTMVG